MRRNDGAWPRGTLTVPVAGRRSWNGADEPGERDMFRIGQLRVVDDDGC
ncbi:MAG: hypothetical protein ACYCS7_02505 [Acidimicrobiales bacterium]